MRFQLSKRDPMRDGVAIVILCLAAMPARADDAPVFFADPITHGQVARFSPDGNFTVRWMGACVAGRGVLHSQEGDFTGTWVNGCLANGGQTATIETTSGACGFN